MAEIKLQHLSVHRVFDGKKEIYQVKARFKSDWGKVELQLSHELGVEIVELCTDNIILAVKEMISALGKSENEATPPRQIIEDDVDRPAQAPKGFIERAPEKTNEELAKEATHGRPLKHLPPLKPVEKYKKASEETTNGDNNND